MSDETISPEEQTDESETTQQNQDVEAQLKRALADYQNLQKRFEKEKQDVVRYANENLLLNML
ncbi:nucleotide exchange factor GrpE, partial [candidate division WWE3 bacterium]|nr:nucleotide exchange factor GrpE [candidate division WWE3 bacterium]